MTGEKGLEPLRLRLENPRGILKKIDCGLKEWQFLQQGVGSVATELKTKPFLGLVLDEKWLRPKEFGLETT
jgi:hypothetical protein